MSNTPITQKKERKTSKRIEKDTEVILVSGLSQLLQVTPEVKVLPIIVKR
jgi:hypothetical protein